MLLDRINAVIEADDPNAEGHWVTIAGHPVFIPGKAGDWPKERSLHGKMRDIKKRLPSSSSILKPLSPPAAPASASEPPKKETKPRFAQEPNEPMIVKTTPASSPAPKPAEPKVPPPGPTPAPGASDEEWNKWTDAYDAFEKARKASPTANTFLTPARPLTPEEKQMRHLVNKLNRKPIDRTAAGGLVFKDFKAEKIQNIQVLITRAHEKWGGYWLVPKGGVDLGEHIHDGAAREVEEETGVKSKVIPGHEPFVHAKQFGGSGKYDLPLAAKTLKDAFPEEADFIEKNKDLLKDEYFSWVNHEHYFLMQHTGGEPNTKPDKHEEMSEAKFVPLKEAVKIPRIATVLKGLMPEIERQWREAGGKGPETPASPEDKAKKQSMFDRIMGRITNLDW